MAKNQEMRKRVERILGGNRHTDDLTRILLFLRWNSFGLDTVREIGDFVAHSNERHKGPVTDIAKEFFALLLDTMSGDNKKHVVSPEWCRMIRRNLDEAPNQAVKARTGVTKNTAKAILEHLIKTFPRLPDGRLVVTNPGTFEARRVLSTFNVLTLPRFDDSQLFDELVTALKKNDLLKDTERAKFEEAKIWIILQYLVSMHQTRIVLQFGATADLAIGIFPTAPPAERPARLMVYATVKLPTSGLPIGTPMVETSLSSEWCTAPMVDCHVQCPVFVGPTGTIDPL